MTELSIETLKTSLEERREFFTLALKTLENSMAIKWDCLDELADYVYSQIDSGDFKDLHPDLVNDISKDIIDSVAEDFNLEWKS